MLRLLLITLAASATVPAADARFENLEGRIDWDASKPNGQDYRAYDLSRLTALGFTPEISLEQGLTRTWEWYCEDQQRAGKANA